MSQQLVPTKFDLPSDVGGKDLGIFMPIANGGWILSKNKPELDGSYAYNRQVAVLAEKHGYDFIMSMAKYRGYVAGRCRSRRPVRSRQGMDSGDQGPLDPAIGDDAGGLFSIGGLCVQPQTIDQAFLGLCRFVGSGHALQRQ